MLVLPRPVIVTLLDHTSRAHERRSSFHFLLLVLKISEEVLVRYYFNYLDPVLVSGLLSLILLSLCSPSVHCKEVE